MSANDKMIDTANTITTTTTNTEFKAAVAARDEAKRLVGALPKGPERKAAREALKAAQQQLKGLKKSLRANGKGSGKGTGKNGPITLDTAPEPVRQAVFAGLGAARARLVSEAAGVIRQSLNEDRKAARARMDAAPKGPDRRSARAELLVARLLAEAFAAETSAPEGRRRKGAGPAKPADSELAELQRQRVTARAAFDAAEKGPARRAAREALDAVRAEIQAHKAAAGATASTAAGDRKQLCADRDAAKSRLQAAPKGPERRAAREALQQVQRKLRQLRLESDGVDEDAEDNRPSFAMAVDTMFTEIEDAAATATDVGTAAPEPDEQQAAPTEADLKALQDRHAEAKAKVDGLEKGPAKKAARGALKAAAEALKQARKAAKRSAKAGGPNGDPVLAALKQRRGEAKAELEAAKRKLRKIDDEIKAHKARRAGDDDRQPTATGDPGPQAEGQSMLPMPPPQQLPSQLADDVAVVAGVERRLVAAQTRLVPLEQALASASPGKPRQEARTALRQARQATRDALKAEVEQARAALKATKLPAGPERRELRIALVTAQQSLAGFCRLLNAQ